ncbi:26120_t:CDS:2, partial [Dentiscutata erythropus]
EVFTNINHQIWSIAQSLEIISIVDILISTTKIENIITPIAVIKLKDNIIIFSNQYWKTPKKVAILALIVVAIICKHNTKVTINTNSQSIIKFLNSTDLQVDRTNKSKNKNKFGY